MDVATVIDTGAPLAVAFLGGIGFGVCWTCHFIPNDTVNRLLKVIDERGQDLKRSQEAELSAICSLKATKDECRKLNDQILALKEQIKTQQRCLNRKKRAGRDRRRV